MHVVTEGGNITQKSEGKLEEQNIPPKWEEKYEENGKCSYEHTKN